MSDDLKNLAVSDTGFLFDPMTGNTFTMNETGVYVLKLLKEGKDKNSICKSIMEEYEVEIEQADRDVTDLLIQLQEMGLYK